MKVTDAVRSATIRRCLPNVGVEFVDRSCGCADVTVMSQSRTSVCRCLEQVDVLGRDIVVWNLSTEMNGLVATAC